MGSNSILSSDLAGGRSACTPSRGPPKNIEFREFRTPRAPTKDQRTNQSIERYLQANQILLSPQTRLLQRSGSSICRGVFDEYSSWRGLEVDRLAAHLLFELVEMFVERSEFALAHFNFGGIFSVTRQLAEDALD
jgi:hypothetical protein